MVVGRTGVSEVMVGRSGELAAVADLFKRLPGDPQLALVSGEAGVGKTRLVGELLGQLPPETTVLMGAADEGSLGRPYGLLLDAVTGAVAGWTDPPAELAARADALRMLLETAAPALGAPPDRPFTSEELVRAGADLVAYLAGGRPAVVVFEDLQWADPESLALFARLALTSGLPVLLVGTHRAEDAVRRSRALADLVANLERRRQVERIVLARLDRAAVGELLADVYGCPVPVAVADAIHNRTGGNPFFIEELVASAGGTPIAALAHLPLPTSLTDAVVAHLDGLSPTERRTIDAAAVLGGRIPFDPLASVTGLDEDDLIDVLRGLVGRGLLVETAPDVFAFRHALTREAVSGRLLGRERRRLHEKALAALSESGSEDWAALAAHATAAGRFEEAVAAARTGAEAYLRSGATMQALALADQALEEAGADLALLEVATRAAWAVGLRSSAIERAGQWREAAAGDDRLVFESLRVEARIRFDQGDREGQEQLAAQALAVAERLGPSETLADAYNLTGEVVMLGGRPEEALSWLSRAEAMAAQVGADHLRSVILINEGSALFDIPGHADEAEARLEEAIVAAEEHGQTHAALRGLHNLVTGLYRRRPIAVSRERRDRMAALAERSGRLDWLPDVTGMEAMLLADVEGDLPGARASYASRPQEEGEGDNAWWSQVHDAALALETGERAAAAALTSWPPDGMRPVRRGAIHGLAVALARHDRDPAGALTHLEAMAGIGDTKGPDQDAWAEDLLLAGRAAVAAGADPPAVRRLTEPGSARIQACPAHLGRAWPAHLEAALLEAEGDLAGALMAGREAIAVDGELRPPSVRADLHMVLARSYLATGDAAQARAEARTARELLHRWPGWRRDEADALLRRLQPAKSEAATPEDPGALTPREREVAALVAEGLSNRQIGQRLYISTKTASVHVSNILAKLSMSSRAEIAAWVAGGSGARVPGPYAQGGRGVDGEH